jgi:voltage-gated potassium channel Kch
MEHFAPGSAINADDRFGDYLALSIQRPVNHQLLRWLMDNDQEQLRPARRDLAARRWVVCAEGEFGDAVVQDLAAIGVDVDLVDPTGVDPDVSGSVGFIAGTANETLNIAMAEHARQANPDVYLVVRQETDARKSLLDAMQIESVYIDTEVIAREVLARIVTPVFWSFIEHVLTQDEQWAVQVRDHLKDRCGDRTPQRDVITLSARETPAIADWLLQGKALTLRTLMLRPDDRDSTLPLAALVLVRDGKPHFMPPEDTPLSLDDQVLLVGKPTGLALVREICHYPATVEYLATGRDVPLTWVWQRLTARGRVA